MNTCRNTIIAKLEEHKKRAKMYEKLLEECTDIDDVQIGYPLLVKDIDREGKQKLTPVLLHAFEFGFNKDNTAIFVKYYVFAATICNKSYEKDQLAPYTCLSKVIYE